MLHDAPAGVEFVHKWPNGERRYNSQAAGLAEAVASLRPRVCFFGHHHHRVDWEVSGVPCLGLNLVGRPGNLVAIEMPISGREWKRLGEWPREKEGETTMVKLG